MELMEEEEILDENINEFLKEDLALARRKLDEVATLRGSQVSIKTILKLSVLSPLAEKKTIRIFWPFSMLKKKVYLKT